MGQIMQLIDFNDSKAGALAHGFLKGLAAPVMLFHTEAAPKVPPVTFLQPVMRSDFESMQHDWKMIGSDMQSVVKRYEQNQTNTTR